MDIINELAKRAERFDQELEQFLQNGEPKTLYDAARHLPLAGGKRLRPCLSMLSCEAVGGDVATVIPFAMSLELLHNFTLVHDDIMDKSLLRRNRPTVHVKYDEPTAILAGDLLFTQSFAVMHNIPTDNSIFKKLNFGLVSCIRDICEGQQLDMEFEKRKSVTVEEYFEMIVKKTAALFEFSTAGGAILGGAQDNIIQELRMYGKYIGLAFQIQDDFLDMSSTESMLGKDIGNDIRNGKKTLIAVHSLNNAEGQDKTLIEGIFGNSEATNEEIKCIYKLFQKLHSIDYAKQTALHYSLKAKQCLEVIKDTYPKHVLQKLADYTIYREK